MKKLEVKLSDEHMTRLDAIVTKLQHGKSKVLSRADIIRKMIDEYYEALQKAFASDAACPKT